MGPVEEEGIRMTKAPRMQWWEPRMGEAEKRRLCAVIDSGFPNDGELSREFERRIAALCGTPYAVAVTSGTAALFLALAACGIGPGDEVIVPDLTFIATANAVRLAGAVPVLADIDETSLCLCPESFEKNITSRTKAVIPVHVSGRSANLEMITQIAHQHGIKVIEDAAEALGSGRAGRWLGSFGDAGCFSFTANKIITTGQGGMVITHSREIYDRLRELKDHGRRERGTGGADRHDVLGYNFKFTDLQAAMGLAQLDDLEARRKKLSSLYNLYSEKLSNIPDFRLPGFNLTEGESPLWIDAVARNRDALCAHLDTEAIPYRKFWFPLHTQKPYLAVAAHFPVASSVSGQAFWLASSLNLSEENVDFISRSIREYKE